MPRYRRVLAPALTAVLGLALASGSSSPAGAAVGAVGKLVTVQSGVSLSGYDAATTKDGTTYVGWIGDTVGDAALREVHLCVLKPGASSCTGGVQTASALGPSTAQDLHVVVTNGKPELVWIAQVTATSGDYQAVFGTASVTGNTLSASTTIGGAPTYGTLTSVVPHANGTVSAAVIGNSTLDNHVYYYPTLTSTPKSFTRPYFVGNAQLADNGKQTVLTTSQYGSLSGRVAMTSKPSNGAPASWKAFSTVAHSYTGGGIEQLRVAGGHIWMVGMSDKALYTPYSWRWSGSSFGNPTTTGDHHDISSIDTTTDSSGRLVSADTEVGELVVSNFGQGSRAARFAMKVKDTYAGGPAQISTNASGRGFLIWGIERTGTDGQILRAQPILLPAVTHTVHQHGRLGTVTLTGPASCMPVSTTHVSVKGNPVAHGKVKSKSMHLGSKAQGGTLNGAHLSSSHSYTLRGTVVFAKGSARSHVTASLSFKTCGRP